jgi:hypothetical protein
MNKGQLVTRYIKHFAESANFKGGTLIKHRNGLIGNRLEMPNVSYTHPLPARLQKKDISVLYNFNNFNYEKSNVFYKPVKVSFCNFYFIYSYEL